MSARELMNLFSFISGQELNLEQYEIDMLRERAKEYKLSNEEMDKLNEIIKNDIFYQEQNQNIYNLLNGETYTLNQLCKLTKLSTTIIRERIRDKKCINNVPYSFDKEENPLFFKINGKGREKFYKCIELNMVKSRAEWREYFNDEKFNASYYYKNNWKYQGKYSFTEHEKQLWEVL